MYARMAGEFVRARKALFASRECATERLFSRVRADVTSLQRGKDVRNQRSEGEVRDKEGIG